MKDCFEKTVEETALTIKEQERWFILDANTSDINPYSHEVTISWTFLQRSKITHFQILDGFIARYLKPSRTN